MKLLNPAIIVAAVLTAGSAMAGPFDRAIEARQGLMDNLAFNLGILGGMAKGAIPYNAAAAKTAADNLVTLTTLNMGAYWPKGSDDEALKNNDVKTHALPAIWEKEGAFMDHYKTLHDASLKMQAAAGSGQAGIQGAIRAVGGACGACHKAFRAPE
ncbi:hypothetical protein U879_12645 [Defluviimonas sp. 20V17]|uniref:Cytochrome c-554 n=1 Tax=Allgaiera indica TaxID=765699 RepID=A0AAN4UQ76_9RHOB|nr:cytochrome c [Allgaiera indica]KDB03360.1 hypothetical protein U879_12645 [Defluviimonas sp. 20V17]GHE00496.1 cytochrome c-554 [Allgaiera indica]SDW60983.1 Cytochrome c556 [Allgaiera indica]